MSELMFQMYSSGEIDKNNVSVNSAFICILHLANEKNLQFSSIKEKDFII
jgi:hypothetical protein